MALFFISMMSQLKTFDVSINLLQWFVTNFDDIFHREQFLNIFKRNSHGVSFPGAT